MEGRRWADNKEEDEQKWGVTQYVCTTHCGTMPTGMYRHNDVVRVSGQIKSFGGKKSINVQHMRPIKDPHEIYFHLLEVVTVTLAIERGPVRFDHARVLVPHSYLNMHTSPENQVKTGTVARFRVAPLRTLRRAVRWLSTATTRIFQTYRGVSSNTSRHNLQPKRVFT
jgi:hypothetical protein